MEPHESCQRPARRKRSQVTLVAAGLLALLTAGLIRSSSPASLTAGLALGEVAVEAAGPRLTISSLIGRAVLRIGATTRNETTNRGFNFTGTTLDLADIHDTRDDVAPIRIPLGTVGGNHGFPNVAAFANPDRKATEDLGSVWTDGKREYVLLAIDRSGQLVVGGDYRRVSGIVRSALVAPSGDLVPVSGAKHLAPIIGEAKPSQLYPSTTRVDVKVWLDGRQLEGDTQKRGREATVHETYEVLDYSDLYDKAKSNPGTPYPELHIRGESRLDTIYRFAAGGTVRVQAKVTALKPTLMGATGLLQAVQLTANSGEKVVRQVPGVRPIGGYDFRQGVDLSRYHTSVRVTHHDLLQPSSPPAFSIDRVVGEQGTRIGFVIGYIETGTHAGSRAAREKTAGDLWDLRATGKSYPVAVTGQHLAEGDALTIEGFRSYLTAERADKLSAAIADGETTFNSPP